MIRRHHPTLNIFWLSPFFDTTTKINTYYRAAKNRIHNERHFGLDPDKDSCTTKEDENKWLKAHPEKRELTEAEKEVLRDRMLKIRQGLIPV